MDFVGCKTDMQEMFERVEGYCFIVVVVIKKHIHKFDFKDFLNWQH